MQINNAKKVNNKITSFKATGTFVTSNNITLTLESVFVIKLGGGAEAVEVTYNTTPRANVAQQLFTEDNDAFNVLVSNAIGRNVFLTEEDTQAEGRAYLQN
jgi:hypothetical protein